jgi:hypothetical protein|tara:strand:- start:667 stop:903 length:237 start_codon:yes stop_codon:yes gene_type:complete
VSFLTQETSLSPVSFSVFTQLRGIFSEFKKKEEFVPLKLKAMFVLGTTLMSHPYPSSVFQLKPMALMLWHCQSCGSWA